MSDFLLDLRPGGCRALDRAAERLSFTEDTRALVIDRADFGLVATQTGDSALWGPYLLCGGSFVAVAGRPAFDEAEWQSGCARDGTGGAATRIIHRRYERDGGAALEGLNGNCAVIVHDSERHLVHLVTDCCGVLPVFEVDTAEGPVYGSHPDVLADAAGQSHRLDEVSLAEFVISGTVTPPFSYYERVRAADAGTIFTFDLSAGRPARPSKRRHFELTYRGDPRQGEEELAEELAAALRRAVKRRTLPRLGRTAVALSGGLDSRVVLASSVNNGQTFAFCCYDEPNRELKTAEAIATAVSAPFLAVRRGSEYYADHAEAGVRISGGMGSFANNHFLGVIPRLKHEGAENLLTGCYCDYLFKALPLNRRAHWLTRRETLAPFRDQFYFDHVPARTALAARAAERWQARIPLELRKQDTVATVFEVEARRSFPLCYEGDNQQRVVPQRVTGWNPPFVDREVMNVYCRIPYYFKLNRSIFRKVAFTLPPKLRAIADTSTAAAVDASPASAWLSARRLRLQRKWQRLSAPATSDESWPNWQHYVRHSARMHALWSRPNSDAMDLFRRVLGNALVLDDVDGLKRNRPFLFVSLLTVKLWLEQRAC